MLVPSLPRLARPTSPAASGEVRAQSPAQAGRLSPLGVAVRLFATCWLIFALHFSTNTVREIYPALSLGDRLSFDVSEYLGLHPDIFAVPGRGAFIDNNPGASIMGAIPYALTRPIIDRITQQVAAGRATVPNSTVEYDSPYPMAREFYRAAVQRGLDVKFALGAAVMQALLMAPLSALSVVLMFFILLRLTQSTRAAGWLALLYGLATPVLYRTAQLNHNLLLAHTAFLAFALLWYPRSGAPPGRLRFLGAGLLCGWGVVLDYSGVVVVLVLGSYAMLQWATRLEWRRTLVYPALFAIGVVASLSVLAIYQWQAFGSPLIPAQRLMPPTALSVNGFNGMDWPQLDLLWETTFGLRFGLFASAPLLLLGLYPPAWKSRWGPLGARELGCIAAMCLLFFLFAAANQFGRLQFNSGVRYVVPLVPFLFLLVARVLRMLPLPLAIALGIAGTFWSWCLAMYRDVEQGSGVLESPLHIVLEGPRLPWMTTLERLGYLHPGTLLLPVLLGSALAIWLIWWRRPARPVDRSTI